MSTPSPRLAPGTYKFTVKSIEQAVSLGIGIATVLHYLRIEEVVHLDVNTNNIILQDRVPRLIDFDIARPVREASALTFSTGSPRCAAPEQFAPPTHGRPGPASDIWGLGATLFRCVSERFPFPLPSADPEATPEERFPQATVPHRDLPESVPRALVELIDACLHKSPDQRPTPLSVVTSLQSLMPQLANTIQPNSAN